METECVGCSALVLAVVSGYCQTCSDIAEAWSEARAERLERALQGLEAAEKREWTAFTPEGLRDPDYFDRLYRESFQRMTPKMWRIVGHQAQG